MTYGGSAGGCESFLLYEHTRFRGVHKLLMSRNSSRVAGSEIMKGEYRFLLCEIRGMSRDEAARARSGRADTNFTRASPLVWLMTWCCPCCATQIECMLARRCPA